MRSFPSVLLLLGGLASASFVSSFVPHVAFRERVALRAEEAPELEEFLPHYVRRPTDGSIQPDQNGDPLTRDRLLSTHPLRSDLLSRPGPGGRELTYLAGDKIISTMNLIFGYDGWNLEVLNTEQLMKEEVGGRWQVAYSAHVRITLKDTGTFKEDYGTGDSQDRSLANALSLSLKASVTDAVKRTARHFGDKLGNCLYSADFDKNKAPKNLREALDRYDQQGR